MTEYVNSFFASIFHMEEFHETANLTFPSRGQIPDKLFKIFQRGISRRNSSKCQKPMVII